MSESKAIELVERVPAAPDTRRVWPTEFAESNGGGAAPDTGLAALLSVLNKRRNVILLVTALVFAAGVAYCYFADELYKAQTTLEIRGYEPILQQADFENLIGKDTRRLEYSKTTIAKLSGLIIADKALQTDNLAEDVRRYFKARAPVYKRRLEPINKWVKKKLGIVEFPDNPLNDKPFHFSGKFLGNYLGLIDISPIKDTTLVEIEVSTTNPRLSQKIANIHAAVFIEHLRKERQEEMRENLGALEQHANDLKQKLRAIEEEAAAYARDQRLVALTSSKDEEIVGKNISDVKEMLSQATAKRIKSESLLREVEKVGVGNASVLDDPVIKDITARLKEAQARFSVLNSKVTSLYPPVLDLQQEISSLSGAIRQQREQRYRALLSEFNSDASAEQALVAQVESEREAANETSRRLLHYNLLMREAQSLRSLTDMVNQELKQTQIIAESSKSNIYISDQAALPRQPFSPKISIILCLSLILGFGLGCSLALVLAALDNRISGADDAEQALALPPLGSIPAFTRAAIEGRQNILRLPKFSKASGKKSKTLNGNLPAPKDEDLPRHLVTISAPQAAVSEALRTIRAGVLFSSADNPARVILVSSCAKGEGKTTVATNLAVSLAQASYKTLLIDADLRNPTASRYFGIASNTDGLVNFLTGHAQIKDILLPTSIPMLSIIAAGAVTPNPAEMLGSRKLAEALRYFATRFDFVILDSAPAFPVADTLMLSRAVDGVLFVVRSGRTERPLAQEGVRRLRRVGARLIGVVVNGVPAEAEYYPPYEILRGAGDIESPPFYDDEVKQAAE